MILIADSGSTKTSWCLRPDNGVPEYYLTGGLNPFFRNTEEIVNELRIQLLPKTGAEVKQIFFYGAGVINQEKGNIVKKALLTLYPNAEVEVQSDLLAAARSTLGSEKGIACILGTGSNSCLYNGIEIIEHVSPLGFILGDEGSGAVLGRKLLADFLKGIMPLHISGNFRNRFNFDYAGFMEGVYKKEKPNQFLAQLVPFIKENISEVYCSTLVESSFDEFIKRNICSYSDYKNQPVCFVGSVAFYFEEQLKIVFDKNQLQLKSVVKEPMDGLIQYHTEKKKNEYN